MIGATFWARYFPVFALGPILVTLGVFFDNQTLVDWGNNFQKDNLWIFLGGFAMIALMTGILVAGIRTTFRWQNAFWIIASLGTFIAFIALLLGNSADFQAHFNEMNAKFGGGTTAAVITAAKATGAAPNAGNLDATLPSIFAIMVFMMWNWWSVYLSGELKSAANRGRQLGIMFGALAWDVIFIVLGVLLLFKVTGYDFMVAVNTSGNTAYAIPSGPWYHFLAALTYNIPVLTILIVGSFLFWSLPAMVGNTFMPIRSVFAWSFDRLLPEKFSEVNERTHSPVPAILLVMALVTAMLGWSIVSTDFATWLALGVLAGVVCVIIVGRRGVHVPEPAPGSLPGVTGERELRGHPGPPDRGAPVDRRHGLPDLADASSTRPSRCTATRTTCGGSPPSWAGSWSSGSSCSTSPGSSGRARASTSTSSTGSCHRSDRRSSVTLVSARGTRLGPNRVTGRRASIARQRRDEVAQQVEAFADLLGRRVRAGHQEARPAGERDADEMAPRLAMGRPAAISAPRL